jgi:glyoxylase-like metal-dependent hydrolase (beta-lactamase superfamily II)
MFHDLGKLDSRLEGIFMIEGVGLSSNVYVIHGEKATLIDAGVGDENNRLDLALQRLKLPVQKIEKVILTHNHPDHYGGLLTIQSISSPEIFAHELDSYGLEELYPNAVKWLHDNEVLTASQRRLRVLHTPGHTAGSICLLDETNRVLFSGDTVFADGFFGRTDLPTGNTSELVESLRSLSELDVESLLPGHERILVSDASSHIKMSYETASTSLDTQ